MDLSGVSVMIAETSDPESLLSMASQAKVVLNCVGPVCRTDQIPFLRCLLIYSPFTCLLISYIDCFSPDSCFNGS